MPGCAEAIKKGWDLTVWGNPMYKVTCKLKGVKQSLIEWAKERDLHNPERKCAIVKESLELIQDDLIKDPTNVDLLQKEKEAMQHYYEVAKIEEECARLKSRAIWLKSGDQNSKFFHTIHKVRNSTNMVSRLLKTMRGFG